jgi:undecaprenyl-diphosphatase
VSSHATNCFALATFLAYRYVRKINWLPYLLFAWAAVVAYSRPYLGVHYPGDIICGAFVGLGCGSLAYFLVAKTEQMTVSCRAKRRSNED